MSKGIRITKGLSIKIKGSPKNQIENSEIGLYSHKIGQYWLAGGASNTGGNVLKKFFNEKKSMYHN